MASTNKTTNYELSQFLGTDKPAWLSDYNQDMTKIDTQMKANADAATAAAGSASSANTAVGTLANLTTTDKTDLVSAINEVDSHADTAQETATSAATTANAANGTATGLATYLAINHFTTYTTSNMSITSGGGTLRSNSSLTVARNSDGSLAKIYGTIIVDNPTGSSSRVKLNVDTGLRPSEAITVTHTGFIENAGSSFGMTGLNILINTDGTLELFGNIGSGVTPVFRALACVIFITNFGDVPEN